MKIVLKTVEPANEDQPKNPVTTKYIRKNWIIFASYHIAASFAVGLSIAVAMFVFAVLGASKRGKHEPMPIHDALIFSMAFLIFVSAITLLIQLISGPLVFTKDVVCRKCHARMKVNRIEFFRGRYSRPARCECGGKIEPAFLWKPEPGAVETKSAYS